MSLKNMIEKKLVSCPPDTNLKDVAAQMKKEDVGAVLIAKNGKAEGIITDRDLAIRCIANGMDCMKSKVNEVMTKDVKTVGVNDGLKDVFDCMKDSQIRRVVVTDDTGKAVGLLSFGDVMDFLMEEMMALRPTVHPEKPKIAQQQQVA